MSMHTHTHAHAHAHTKMCTIKLDSEQPNVCSECRYITIKNEARSLRLAEVVTYEHSGLRLRLCFVFCGTTGGTQGLEHAGQALTTDTSILQRRLLATSRYEQQSTQ